MAYELTDAMPDTLAIPSQCASDHMTRNSEEVILTIMTDVQKAVDQLSHMNSFDDDDLSDTVDDKAAQEAADGHVPFRPAVTSTSLVNDGTSDVYRYRVADEAFPNSTNSLESHRRITEEDKGDYRKFVLTRNAAIKAGVHPDTPQSPFPQYKGRSNLIPTAATNGASLPSAWPLVSSAVQTINLQNATFSTTSLPVLASSGERRHAHPAYWTVQETAEWLRSKGFEEAVCEKFVEQEIAGDALLKLDASKLKTEIGIVAYGKRVRIDTAISECRRLARVMSASTIQPMQSPSPSRIDLSAPQMTALGRAPMRSASVGNLSSSKGPPGPGNLRRAPSMPIDRSSDPAGDPGEQPTVDKSDSTMGLRLWVSSLLSPESGQGNTMEGTSPLSLSRDDRTGSQNTKDVAVEQEGKGDPVVSIDKNTNDVASERRDDPFDSQNPSSSAIKMSSPRSMEQRMPLPPETRHIRHSQSLRERRKVNSAAMYENFRLSHSGSTLAGTLGMVPKLYRRYFGGETETSPDPGFMSNLFHDSDTSKSGVHSPATDADTGYRNEDHPEQRESNDSGDSEKDHTPQPKHELSSADSLRSPSRGTSESILFQGILTRIGRPDHDGWMRKKGGFYNTWKNRYFVLKGPHLYWLRSNSVFETKVEGYVNTTGYRIIPDENINPGRYGFKLEHDVKPAHFFSSNDKTAIRRWITVLLKIQIGYDCTNATGSPINIPVIPLAVAQAMNPPPRPPSPTAQAAARQAVRRESSIRSYRRAGSFFTRPEAGPSASPSPSAQIQAPVRPPRDMRRNGIGSERPFVEPELIKWANSRLPGGQITSKGSICSRPELLRIAQSVKNMRSFTDADSGAFSHEHDDDDILDGLFSLIDLLLDKEVETGMVDVADDVRPGSRDKVIKLLKALRAWEKRHTEKQPTGKSP